MPRSSGQFADMAARPPGLCCVTMDSGSGSGCGRGPSRPEVHIVPLPAGCAKTPPELVPNPAILSAIVFRPHRSARSPFERSARRNACRSGVRAHGSLLAALRLSSIPRLCHAFRDLLIQSSREFESYGQDRLRQRAIVAKPNFRQQKRQKELARKERQSAKLLKRGERPVEEASAGQSAPASDPAPEPASTPDGGEG
jgi:hypothetical protein